MKKLFLALVLIVCMASPVMAQDFIIGDSTYGSGPSNMSFDTLQQYSIVKSWDEKDSTETTTHFFTPSAGDTIKSIHFRGWTFGNDDTISVALFATLVSTPWTDTICTGTEMLARVNKTSDNTDSLHDLTFATPIGLDTWAGTEVCLVVISHTINANNGVWFRYDANASFSSDRVQRDNLSTPGTFDSPWVNQTSNNIGIDLWVEGTSIGGLVPNLHKGILLDGVLQSSPMIGTTSEDKECFGAKCSIPTYSRVMK